MLEGVLKGFIYLKDVIVPSKSLSDNNRRVRLLLDCLRAANMVLKPEKVQLLKKSMTFIGHLVNKHGVSPDPSKLEAIKDYTTRKCIKNV